MSTRLHHVYDNDAVCVCCGFDGAEWSHWRNHTYEGKALGTSAPECSVQSEYVRNQRIAAAQRDGAFDEPEYGSEDPVTSDYEEVTYPGDL